MGFELTGATPDERLKELTEKLEQGVSEILPVGATRNICLPCQNSTHTVSATSCSFSCKTRLHPVWPGFTHGRKSLGAM